MNDKQLNKSAFDFNWKNNMVYCLLWANEGASMFKTNKERHVPQTCRYILEHSMLSQEET
jgi:hypothetical protein